MMSIKCQWKEPRINRDDPEKEWQPGVLLQFVYDGEYVHGVIVTDAGTLVSVNRDLIHIPEIDAGR